MLKKFKIFVVPGEEGKWETWVSWVNRDGFESEKEAAGVARELAHQYETRDIVRYEKGRAVQWPKEAAAKGEQGL